jgi:hypothetical protein
MILSSSLRLEQIVLAAVQNEGYALQYAHETLKDDELFLSIVDSTGSLIIQCVSERIGEEIRKDLRIVGFEKVHGVRSNKNIISTSLGIFLAE